MIKWSHKPWLVVSKDGKSLYYGALTKASALKHAIARARRKKLKLSALRVIDNRKAYADARKPKRVKAKSKAKAKAKPTSKAKVKAKKRATRDGGKAKPVKVKPVKAKRFGKDLVSTLAEEVATACKRLLDLVIKDFGGDKFVFVSRDLRVDAEWRVPIPRGTRKGELRTFASQIEETIKNAQRKVGLHEGTGPAGRGQIPSVWATMGFRFPPSKTTPDNYDKWQSYLEVTMYPVRFSRRHRNFAQFKKMLAHWPHRKPLMFFVKLHWNAEDQKPTREEIK